MIAELLPPLDSQGQSSLWEAIGRRFTNMDYWEADQLCAKDKEFIFDLFPNGKIYTTFLTAEARNAIGKVGKDTEPVWHLLNRIGFKYQDQIDPFDGGPHLWAQTDDVDPVRNSVKAIYSEQSRGVVSESGTPISGLLYRVSHHDPYVAFSADVHLSSDGKLAIAGERAQKLLAQEMKLKAGDTVFFTPYFTET
ncbi:MAG: hypothetical protein EOP09_03300 [Proteobacteria bacterium]|nr:MAG: hypothetical protein EOP09_03300 [Pseudomonadota bacterium]